MKVSVIGAGMAGLTAAVLLKEQGHQVEVFEVKDKMGGACQDGMWQGTLVQYHGPHIFHTNNLACWNFVNRYADFHPFYHIVMAHTEAGMFNLPFNFFSEKMMGRDMTVEDITRHVYRPYSEKMWGMSWDDLPACIRSRVAPKREGFDCRYTPDMYHGIPVGGFSKMFEAMADGITVHLDCGVMDWRKHPADLMVYTGKLDEYFSFERGTLGYRSIDFQHKAEQKREFPIINDCWAANRHTRSTDNGMLMEERPGGNTIITYEYPCDHDDTNEPFYPKPWGVHLELASQYRQMAEAETDVRFFGRLAEYRYMDMNVVVEKALQVFA